MASLSVGSSGEITGYYEKKKLIKCDLLNNVDGGGDDVVVIKDNEGYEISLDRKRVSACRRRMSRRR